MSDLNPRQLRFIEEYLVDCNATRAAIAAGYSAKTAKAAGHRLLTHVDVAKILAERRAAVSEKLEIKAEDVLRVWHAQLVADPNDLVEYRRVPCRHCYGEGGRFQMTPAEDEERRRAHAKDVAAYEHIRKPGWAAMPDYDPMGGAGYDKRKPINPDCAECHGSGTGEMLVKDTRHLTPEALSIYAGVKQTKDGVEIKLHDKAAIAERVARHLGMFKDSVTVEVTGFAEALQRARRRAGRVTDEDEK